MQEREVQHTSVPVGLVCMFASLLCFSCVPVFIRYFVGYLDNWTTNAVRYSVATLVWLPFVFILSKRHPEHKQVWKDALIPFIVNLTAQTGWGLCPYYNAASVIGFLSQTNFLFAILFGFLILPEERKLSKQSAFWFGMLTCVVGVVVMSLGKGGSDGNGSAETSVFGILLMLGTAAVFGMYGVVVQRFTSKYPARLSFGVISLYTALGLVIEMLIFGDYGALGELPGRVWLMVIASGIIGISLAHVLTYRSIQAIGIITTTGAKLGGPFLIALIAFIFLGETMNMLQWIGGVVLVAGGASLVIARLRADRAQPGQAPSQDAKSEHSKEPVSRNGVSVR